MGPGKQPATNCRPSLPGRQTCGWTRPSTNQAKGGGQIQLPSQTGESPQTHTYTGLFAMTPPLITTPFGYDGCPSDQSDPRHPRPSRLLSHLHIVSFSIFAPRYRSVGQRGSPRRGVRRWPTAEGGEPEQFPALRAHALAGAPLANAVGPLGRALRQPPVVQRDPRFREVVAHPEINPLTALRHPDTGKVHTNLKGLLSSSFPRSLPQAASALCSCFSPCRSCTSHTQGTARSSAPPLDLQSGRPLTPRPAPHSAS